MPVSPATNTTIPTAFPAVAATVTPDVGLVGDVVRRKVRAVLWPLTHDTQGAPSFGTEALTRTSVANAADWEGIYRAAASGEGAFQGGRRVENLASGNGTQSVTVVSGNDYQVTIGSGSASGATVVCSNAFTGTLTGDATNRISWASGTPKTAGSTTLTLTVTGTITDLFVEDVTGQSNQNPSEFTSSPVWKNYKNGNTVDGSGVVTEAQGDTLIPDGMLLEDSAKNQITASRDLTDAAWTKRGTVSVTFDTTVTNASGAYGATKITGLGAGGSADVYQFTSALAAGAQRVEPQCLIKKITSTGSIAIANPITASDGLWVIDLSLLGSGWERITRDHAAVSITNEFQSNATNLKSGFQLYRSAAGTYDFYVDLCTIETDSSDGARAFSTSPIETTSGSAIRALAQYYYSITDNLVADNLTIFWELMFVAAPSASERIQQYTVDGTHYAFLGISSAGTGFIFYRVNGPAVSINTTGGAPAANTTYKVAFRLATDGRFGDTGNLFVNGVKDSAGSSSTAQLPLGNKNFKFLNIAQVPGIVVKNHEIIHEPLSDAELVNMTS